MFSFIKKLWNSETRGLTAAAIIVGLASLAADAVGLLRDRLLASMFGAGHALDTYYAAFRLPDLLYNLIILGALSAGFIPVFAEYLHKKGDSEAWRLVEEVVSVVAAVMALACLVLSLAAPIIVPLTVPGFSAAQQALTISLARVMFLSPFLLGLSAVMGGVLQATRRFIAFSLAPIFYNLGIIFGAVVLAPHMGVIGVAWGVVIGAGMHLILQTSVVLHLGLRKLHWPSFKHEGVRRILKLMVPRTLGLAVSQMNLIVLQVFASTLMAGSVAVFNLANNLQTFPVSLVGISYAVAAFPLFSKHVAEHDDEAFKRSIGTTMRKIVFLILPAMAIFYLLRAQAVRLAFGAGLFNWNDTIRTADVLAMFLPSLIAQSGVAVFARAFYAIQNTRVPLVVSVIAEGVNLLVAFLSYRALGVTGLALAFTLSTFTNWLLLWYMLRRVKGSLHERTWFGSFGKSALAALAVLAAGYPVRQFIGSIYPLRTFWQLFFQSAVTGVVGAAAFVIVAILLRSEEWKEFSEALASRWWKTKPQTVGAEETHNL